MLVNLPTKQGYVSVNPRYVTHVTNTCARDFSLARCIVHLDSGFTGQAFTVLGSNADVTRLLNQPNHADHFVNLARQPDGFPGPGSWTDGDGEFEQDWLDAQWVRDQWDCYRDGLDAMGLQTMKCHKCGNGVDDDSTNDACLQGAPYGPMHDTSDGVVCDPCFKGAAT